MRLMVPGKLILMGEYAVLHKGQKGIVMALDLGVTIDIRPSKEIVFVSKETGEQFSLGDGAPHPMTFQYRAIEMTYAYLNEMGIPARPFQMSLESQLNDPYSGISLGLGSSAAVVVALVKGLLLAHQSVYKLDVEALTFKLAYLVHRDVQGNGSGIDIAASCYGGLLLYESLDFVWLEAFFSQTKSLAERVNAPWLGGCVRSLKLPSGIGFTYSWSGEKASSKDLVKAYLEAGDKNPQVIGSFLEKTERAVNAFETACDADDADALIWAVKKQRNHLNQMAMGLGLTLETAKLKSLCDYYEKNGAGKFSGAGGGDCAIGFYKK